MSIPRLIQIMRDQGQSNNNNMFIGEVSSASPLKVKTNDIELDDDQLRTLTDEAFSNGDEVLLVYINSYFIILGKVREAT